MKDLVSGLAMADLGAQTLSGTTPNASDWVDRQHFESLAIAFLTRAVTDAGDASGFTATMQHSDTTADADAVDCVAADAVGGTFAITVTSDTDDNAVIGALGYSGSKQYVRLNCVGTTGTDAVVQGLAILGAPNVQETTFVEASEAAT